MPEMRKDRVYKLAPALQTDSLDKVQDECGCAAGKGPHGSCKHITAFSYAFTDFCRLGTTPEFLTCTDKLQQWNQPRAKCIDPIPVNQLGARRRELLAPRKKFSGANVIFDPQPLAYREPDPGAWKSFVAHYIPSKSLVLFSVFSFPAPKRWHMIIATSQQSIIVSQNIQALNTHLLHLLSISLCILM